jgi:hypothetical protein
MLLQQKNHPQVALVLMLLWNGIFCWYRFYRVNTSPPFDKVEGVFTIILGLCVGIAAWLLVPVALVNVRKSAACRADWDSFVSGPHFFAIHSPIWIWATILIRARS